MVGSISRRQLLKTLVGALGLAGLCRALGIPFDEGMAQERDGQVHFPLVARTGTDDSTPTATPPPRITPSPEPTATVPPPPTGATVVHIHDESATAWDFGDGYYGDFVDQDAVNAMVDEGVTALTGTAAAAEAWQALVPDYSPGKAIAIKVNFNNNWACEPTHVNLNNVIHPINAIVRGLCQAYPDFQGRDVWVYDASGQGDSPPRELPTRFTSGCLYDGVRFFDNLCNETAGYASTDPSAVVTWHNPAEIPTPPQVQVTDVLVNAAYLINIPVVKRHAVAGVTLSFKNHFGSIENCQQLHNWVYPGHAHYGGQDYSPMVDIYRNKHIAGKTVLTLGDALFGNWVCNNSKAQRWKTFGHAAPNSLLFSGDPVALDCVMSDLLDAEHEIGDFSDDHLVYASRVGLGTHERGEPWGDGYSHIRYVYLKG